MSLQNYLNLSYWLVDRSTRNMVCSSCIFVWNYKPSGTWRISF